MALKAGQLAHVSWREFRDRLLSYAAMDSSRRVQLLFRGQRHSSWNLETTLDRAFVFSDLADRARTNRRLLDEFRQELISVDRAVDLKGDALELLARHHGLPSPLMDWTQSPYIASYFAFGGATAASETVRVWAFDRAAASVASTTIAILDDPDLIRFNRRAMNQRGIFIRAERDTRHTPLEEQFSDAVSAYELPVSDRRTALADLDEMRINAAALFADFDGAASTASARVLSERPL